MPEIIPVEIPANTTFAYRGDTYQHFNAPVPDAIPNSNSQFGAGTYATPDLSEALRYCDHHVACDSQPTVEFPGIVMALKTGNAPLKGVMVDSTFRNTMRGLIPPDANFIVGPTNGNYDNAQIVMIKNTGWDRHLVCGLQAKGTDGAIPYTTDRSNATYPRMLQVIPSTIDSCLHKILR
uniref:Uncharacterized protein n=1 Tax=Cryptomonas curvata TaxID=233186 RepID=A0A7S0MG16_9CRYP|mmetsp:Transcript_36699/g.76654  ORF Transcript_36699/g.76654 Transcript_36699/m.76654 type:complete len:179 (+) Transcript_36699:69-605(+)